MCVEPLPAVVGRRQMLRNCKDTESLDSTTIHMHTCSQSESTVRFICISLDRGRSQGALGLEARIGQLEEAEEESAIHIWKTGCGSLRKVDGKLWLHFAALTEKLSCP